MRGREVAIGAALVAALACAAMWSGAFRSFGGGGVDGTARDRDAMDAEARAATSSASRTAGRPAHATGAAPLAALTPPPDARAALAAQEARRRFEARLRDFLAHAGALDAAERARIAAELDAQVEAEELASRLSADEARLLRLALIERGVADPAERLRRSEALAEAYRLEAERRRRAFEAAQARDPAFSAYKAREAQVVAEVGAMRTIPGGLSRDEYLRQRLQAERERAYAGARGP